LLALLLALLALLLPALLLLAALLLALLALLLPALLLLLAPDLHVLVAARASLLLLLAALAANDLLRIAATIVLSEDHRVGSGDGGGAEGRREGGGRNGEGENAGETEGSAGWLAVEGHRALLVIWFDTARSRLNSF
jgi:hypothetical protein